MNNNNSNNTNPLGNNPANIVPHDSSMRGYSVENSFYDSPYNMDFEYGYLNLMFNITAFAARTQDMFQSLENNLSGIIELQNERRRLDYETRQMRETRETRETNQNSNIRQPMSQSSNESRTTTQATPTTPIPITNRGLTDNINYLLGRRNIFDSSNNVLFSFLPRNVLLNPTTLSENMGGRNTRRNINGLTIQEIEDNTEIITYSSINTSQRLNTECPISRDSFNENSVVLRVKECRHCFVPFRMMTWLESHSTCPLCRENVVPAAPTAAAPAPAAAPTAAPAPATAPAPASTSTFSNIINNIRNSTNLNNLSIDNMNDDSIMFSFDLPRTQNDIYDREFTNTYLSSLSEIFSNLSRNTPAAATSTATSATAATTDASANPTQPNSEPSEYEEVD
jgi:hypothetical protein